MKVRLSRTQLRNIILEEINGVLGKVVTSSNTRSLKERGIATGGTYTAAARGVPGGMATGGPLPSNIIRIPDDDTYGYVLAPDNNSYTAYKLATGVKIQSGLTDGLEKVTAAAYPGSEKPGYYVQHPEDDPLAGIAPPEGQNPYYAGTGGTEAHPYSGEAESGEEGELSPRQMRRIQKGIKRQTRQQGRAEKRSDRKATRDFKRTTRQAQRGLQETIESMVRAKIKQLI